MPEPIHVRARKFLQEFFNDEDLTNFCFDYFPQVYNDFSQGMPKSQKVRMLVEDSQRRGRFDELLAALERERPKSYPDHFAEQPHLIEQEPKPQSTIERNARQIFISHAHQDAKFAQRLAADLRTNGWQTWMAPDNIRPGEKWMEAINRGLEESGAFVLILTPAAIDSRWVRQEMYAAIELEHHGNMHLFPLSVKSTVMPPLWSGYQWIGFEADYEIGLAALLSELDPPVTPPVLMKATKFMPPENIEEIESSIGFENASTIQLEQPLLFEKIRKPNQLRAMIMQLNTLLTRVLFGGGIILLIILVVFFWPDASNDPTVEPTSIFFSSQQTKFTREQDGMQQVVIPSTTFMMGARDEDELAEPDERSRHEVTVGAFAIDLYEVNVAQYAAFLSTLGQYVSACNGFTCLSTRFETTRSYIVDNTVEYAPVEGFGDYPINNVSWHGANAYCQWVGGRLPTEAEWELAATGGDGRFYPWGDALEIDEEGTIPAIFAGTFDNLQPVNSLSEGTSPFGLHHTAGNVWEWVADGYDPIYYDRSPEENPTGPEVSVTADRVMRGGGYDSAAVDLRTTNRASERAPEFRLIANTGFRCVTLFSDSP